MKSLLFRTFGLIKLDSTWDIVPDLRHAPLIISESGCNAHTKTVSTPRCEIARQTGVRRKKESGSEQR